MGDVRAKICGLSRTEDVAAAAKGGAAYMGFVFFQKSPRAVTPAVAGALAAEVPPGICKVGLFVNMDDADLDAVLAAVPLDMLQLHGSETPERVAQIKARTGLPVMKALAIAEAGDLAAARAYEKVADWLLFDAKPPKSLANALPGGNGLVFDWTLLTGFESACPWMLSGGLDADNVAEAVRISGARAVDVSSGVESEPGLKDPDRIRAFAASARS